jgi:hypothetical protein
MAAFRHARYGKPLTDPIIASEFDKMRKPADDLIAGNITPEQVITATEAALSRWSDPTRVTLSSVASWITDLLAPRPTPNSAAPAQRPPESYRAYRSPEEIAESQARARALMEEVEGQRKIRAAAHAAKLKAEEEAKALSLATGAYS